MSNCLKAPRCQCFQVKSNADLLERTRIQACHQAKRFLCLDGKHRAPLAHLAVFHFATGAEHLRTLDLNTQNIAIAIAFMAGRKLVGEITTVID